MSLPDVASSHESKGLFEKISHLKWTGPQKISHLEGEGIVDMVSTFGICLGTLPDMASFWDLSLPGSYNPSRCGIFYLSYPFQMGPFQIDTTSAIDISWALSLPDVISSVM